jgi:hypothetical protein
MLDGLRLVPNPARVTTAIEFELAVAGRVRIDVYDVAGRHVARIADGLREAGPHRVTWEAGVIGRAGPGLYFVRLEAGGRTARRSLVLLK